MGYPFSMIYLSEIEYLRNRNFPFKKAVRVTAKAVTKWCKIYSAGIIACKQGVSKDEIRGKLPNNKIEKEKIVDTTINWIFKNSCVRDLFALFLYKDASMKHSKFDHHDDTCCWILNLTKEEFKQLQKEWKSNNLPADLFYPQNKGIFAQKIPSKLDKLFDSTTGYCFSPRAWEKQKKKFVGNPRYKIVIGG